LAGEPRILLGIDDDDAFGSFDRTCIGVAAGADPGMHPVGDGDEMRFALLFGYEV
jgi:hypothetical protein